MKPTKGPWIVHPTIQRVGTHNVGLDVGPSGVAVAIVIGEFDKFLPGDECEANARLIAAAPEMLELVRVLVNFTVNAVDPQDFAEIRNTAQALIAHIEGEE